MLLPFITTILSFDKMVLKRGHNICFKEEIWKIILKYLLYPFLSGTMLVHIVSHNCKGKAMGNNFCDFLFASPGGCRPARVGSVLQRDNMHQGEQILSFKS